MSNHSQQIVQKLWNYCNVLRDDGLSYGDYVEQLTYLLFLKMADERTQPPWQPAIGRSRRATTGRACCKMDGDALEVHYRTSSTSSARSRACSAIIFRKAQNKIQDPAKLRRLIVDLIDSEQWIDARRRRQGRRLRGPAGEERAGHQVRRRPVLHAAPADPGDRRRDAARSPARRSATRPAAPAASSSPPTTTSSQHIPNLDRDQKRHLQLGRSARVWSSSTAPPGCAR